ncbi:MAG: glycosyltransferase family 4 protein [Gammaproteobacteria bacterium]|jgi:glycosyltransferase involved in cell wall biosynthesis|nr:glycosyltransferase family 4 protein [Gammaproteobacteria bacterium]
MSDKAQPKVILISEYPPPAAGMTVQAQQLLTRLQEEGYPIQEVRTNPILPSSFSWIEKIKVIRSLIKWLIFITSCRKIIKADIVHIFSSSGLNYYLFTLTPIVLSSLLNKKVIINYHGGGAESFFNNNLKLLAWSMSHCDKLVVPSRFLQEVFEKFGYKSEVIGNIANVEQFNFKKRKIDVPVVISTRNLTSLYNIECAVKSFSILQRDYPKAIFYIAGDGPEKENLKLLVARLNLRNVHFLGNLQNEDVVSYIDRSNIFINTSTVDNMPGSILEAFASGLPVVSTNVGGIPYMVEHGVTGLLAGNNDYKKLGELLVSVLGDSKLTSRLIDNGYAQILGLKGEIITELWTTTYSQLIDNR